MGCWCWCHIPTFCVVFLVLIFIIFGIKTFLIFCNVAGNTSFVALEMTFHLCSQNLRLQRSRIAKISNLKSHSFILKQTTLVATKPGRHSFKLPIDDIHQVVKKEKSAASVWFILLIQEVTYWEMSIKQVAIPDQALEFQQCVDSRGFKKITSAPSCSVCLCVCSQRRCETEICWCVVCQVS